MGNGGLHNYLEEENHEAFDALMGKLVQFYGH